MQSLLRTLSWTLLCIISMIMTLQQNSFSQAGSEKPIRLGIIGLDTSHVVEFTRRFNDPSDPEFVPGAKVVAAYKGGSPDLPDSWGRVDKYTTELHDKWKVEIVNDIPTLCSKVDAILLESLDGRKHLEQVKPVLAAHKPVFIDKPLAADYQDAREIARLAKEAGVPWFSTSSLRYWEETVRLKNDPESGGIVGCSVYGPCELEPHHVDLTYYGIHAVEILFTIMGPGCESVNRVHTEDTDVVVGKWKDGRIGVMRGIRKGPYEFGITLFGRKKILTSEPKKFTYRPMLVEIVKFFETRVPPVSADETLDMFAFMQAADISKARGGVLVPLSEVTK
jgi:Oxidoreductase family, NAD-binding Rossmann fold